MAVSASWLGAVGGAVGEAVDEFVDELVDELVVWACWVFSLDLGVFHCCQQTRAMAMASIRMGLDFFFLFYVIILCDVILC